MAYVKKVLIRVIIFTIIGLNLPFSIRLILASTSKASSNNFEIKVPDAFINPETIGKPSPNFKMKSKVKPDLKERPIPIYKYDEKELRENILAYIENKYGKGGSIESLKVEYFDKSLVDGISYRNYTGFKVKVKDKDKEYNVFIDGLMNYIGDDKERDLIGVELDNKFKEELDFLGGDLNLKGKYSSYDMPIGFYFNKKEDVEKLIENLKYIELNIITNDFKEDNFSKIDDFQVNFPPNKTIRIIDVKEIKEEALKKLEENKSYLDLISEDPFNFKRIYIYEKESSKEDAIKIKSDIELTSYGDFNILSLYPYEKGSLKFSITSDRPDSMRKALKDLKPIGNCLLIESLKGEESFELLHILFNKERVSSLLKDGEKVAYFYMVEGEEGDLWPIDMEDLGKAFLIKVNIGKKVWIQPVIY